MADRDSGRRGRRRDRRRSDRHDRDILKPLHDRSTGEIMILMVAATVCGAIVVGGAAVILLAFVHPEYNSSFAAQKLTSLLNTMIGLLAGFTAGRTDVLSSRDAPVSESHPSHQSHEDEEEE